MGEPGKLYQLTNSGHPRKVPWDVFRRETGQCETCDQKIARHDECEACLILCGSGHIEGKPSKYRGHKLCGYCIQTWQKAEITMGRAVEYEEFCRGLKPMDLPAVSNSIIPLEGED